MRNLRIPFCRPGCLAGLGRPAAGLVTLPASPFKTYGDFRVSFTEEKPLFELYFYSFEHLVYWLSLQGIFRSEFLTDDVSVQLFLKGHTNPVINCKITTDFYTFLKQKIRTTKKLELKKLELEKQNQKTSTKITICRSIFCGWFFGSIFLVVFFSNFKFFRSSDFLKFYFLFIL